MAITNGYTTLSAVKGILRLTDNVDDALLETCIEASSRQIDTHCERVFTSGTATRFYAPRDSYVCEVDDLITLTSLVTSSDGDAFDTTWTDPEYQLEPLNGIVGGAYAPFTQIRAVDDLLFNVIGEEATVRVTGRFGYGTAIPIDVTQACNLMSIRQFKRYDSPLGVAGFGDIGVVRVSRVDPDIESLLAPYRKVRFA